MGERQRWIWIERFQTKQPQKPKNESKNDSNNNNNKNMKPFDIGRSEYREANCIWINKHTHTHIHHTLWKWCEEKNIQNNSLLIIIYLVTYNVLSCPFCCQLKRLPIFSSVHCFQFEKSLSFAFNLPSHFDVFCIQFIPTLVRCAFCITITTTTTTTKPSKLFADVFPFESHCGRSRDGNEKWMKKGKKWEEGGKEQKLESTMMHLLFV